MCKNSHGGFGHMKEVDKGEFMKKMHFFFLMKCVLKAHNSCIDMTLCVHTVFALLKCWKCLQSVRPLCSQAVQPKFCFTMTYQILGA